MLFISVPKGMVFKKVTAPLKDSETGETEIRDFFVDPQEILPAIDIQRIVKELLQHNRGRETKITFNDSGITIYRRMPPNTTDLLLPYEPNRNGKFSTLKEPKIITGKDAQKYNPATQTRYGGFWNQNAHLSEERAEQVAEERRKQKEDRRHTGDSPKAT